jgi:hypothetical protein
MDQRGNIHNFIPFWHLLESSVKAVVRLVHWFRKMVEHFFWMLINAIVWLMRRFLKVLARFFWIPMLGLVIYGTVWACSKDGVWSGLISGIIFLILGLFVWAIVYVLAIVVNSGRDVIKAMNEVRWVQDNSSSCDFGAGIAQEPVNSRVVEGSISEVEKRAAD